jgi:glyoxylase I family protein
MDSPISGFSHIQLLVSDVLRSVRWYEDTLGLKAVGGSPEIGHVAMGGGRFVVVLTPRNQAADPGVAPAMIDHLAFGVKTLEGLSTWAQTLTESGVTHSGLVVSGEGTSVHLLDPDGLAIELITSEKAPVLASA